MSRAVPVEKYFRNPSSLELGDGPPGQKEDHAPRLKKRGQEELKANSPKAAQCQRRSCLVETKLAQWVRRRARKAGAK
jgi:hypothetical protein